MEDENVAADYMTYRTQVEVMLSEMRKFMVRMPPGDAVDRITDRERQDMSAVSYSLAVAYDRLAHVTVAHEHRQTAN